MIYKLKDEVAEGKRLHRIYMNESTGSEVRTHSIYEANGITWWGFTDLYRVPYIRTVMAQHILNLFQMGLGLKDILKWCDEEKRLLRSTDDEKYEKLYSLVLEKERMATITADPVKQHLALATVYILQGDERIDYFSEEESEKKLQIWAADLNMTAFFLSWHNEHIARSLAPLEKVFPIVSQRQSTKSHKL